MRAQPRSNHRDSLWRKQFAFAVVLIALCVAVSIRMAAAQCALSWVIVESPNPDTSNNQLKGIAVLSATDAWAVGVYVNRAVNQFQNLALHWDGAQWLIVPTPNPFPGSDQLKKVAAVSSNNVWAVGGHGVAYTLHWDGAVWNVVAAPNPGLQSYLDDISVVAANDIWAVGSIAAANGAVQTLTAHWDGTNWTQIPSPNVAFPDNTGFYSSYFNGVAAVAANDVWAVGQYLVGNTLHTLVEHWDGAQWRIVPSPDAATGDGRLWAVAAASAGDVWAVGESRIADFNSSGQALALHWDGSRWNLSTAPQPSSFGISPLFGITAVSATDIWAVGNWETDTQGLSTFTLHWNGSGWSQVSSPDMAGSGTGQNTLRSVAAAAATDVWAAGQKQSTFGASNYTLVEHYSNACPAPAPTPPPAPTLTSLTLNPSSVSGGNSSQGTVTLSAAAPAGGALVTLSSSNTSAATLPPSVTVAEGTTGATFTITTRTVAASTSVTISASYDGIVQSAALAVTRAPASDTVSIQKSDYITSKKELQVEASSTSTGATLKVYVTATGALIGTLTNNGGSKYKGQFAWPTNPQNITVRSSLGGAATKAVSPK